jgi:hypothetical protein
MFGMDAIVQRRRAGHGAGTTTRVGVSRGWQQNADEALEPMLLRRSNRSSSHRPRTSPLADLPTAVQS